MPAPMLDKPPTEQELRSLLMRTTIRLSTDHGSGIPSVVGVEPVMANAAGWLPSWRAAAVYHRRGQSFRHRGSRPHEAVFVLACERPGEKPLWYTAVVCRWPL